MKKFMFAFLLICLFIGVKEVDAVSCLYWNCYDKNGSEECEMPMFDLEGDTCPDTYVNGGTKYYKDYDAAHYAYLPYISCTYTYCVDTEQGQKCSNLTFDETYKDECPETHEYHGVTLYKNKNDAQENPTSGSENWMNNANLNYKSCGDLDKIPEPVPVLTSFAYNALKILTPVILIFIGMFDLMKSIMAGKEDEIKKTQASFVKKLFIAALVFLLASIVQYVVTFTAKSSESGPVIACMECFLNNNC